MVRAAEDLDSVGEKVCHGIEGFDGAFGAAGEINDNRLVADDRDTPREHGVWSLLDTFAANLLGETRNRAIGDVEGGFGSRVTWPEAGAAGGEKKVGVTGIRDGAQLAADF